jgi:hypothetical protein
VTCSVKPRGLIEVKIWLVPRSELLGNGLWDVQSGAGVRVKRLGTRGKSPSQDELLVRTFTYVVYSKIS